MDPAEQLKRAKAKAAQKALDVYYTELTRACMELGVEIGTLVGEHQHTMLVLTSKGSNVVVEAQWMVSDHPALIKKARDRMNAERKKGC